MQPLTTMCARVSILVLMVWTATVARAQSPETSRPLAEQLSREFASLYQQVDMGLVRVQLPPLPWQLAEVEKTNPANSPRWQGLSREMRQHLARNDFDRAQVQVSGQAVPPKPATAPGAAAAPTSQQTNGAWTVVQQNGQRVLISRGTGALRIESGGQRTDNGQIKTSQPQMSVVTAQDFVPNNVALLLDGMGHMLLPVYVEREAVPAAGLKVSVANQQTTATFVGSDRATGLTVLKLAQALGQPLRLSPQRPQPGAWVVLFPPTPNRNAPRPVLWVDGLQDFGVVANIDGSIAGFARPGQFFSARAAAPVVEQLIRHGRVHRAALGIRVAEVRRDDPARRLNPLVADRPALRVQEVQKRSAAERANLQPGDLIFAIGDEPVGDAPTFAAFLSAQQERTWLQIARGDETHILTLDLRPDRPTTRP